MGGVHRGFAGRHADVQEEVLVAGREVENTAPLDGIQRVQRGDRSGERFDQQRACGAIAIVALVTHVHRLGD